MNLLSETLHVVKGNQIELFKYNAYVLKVGNNICLSLICVVFLRVIHRQWPLQIIFH